MKPEELRIGNWLNYKGIDIEWAIEDFAEVEKAGILEVTKPIPLTPEWLEKFGFEDIEEELILDLGGNELVQTRFMDLWIIRDFWERKTSITINEESLKYVHQLQNFYFAFTGNELNEKTNT